MAVYEALVDPRDGGGYRLVLTYAEPSGGSGKASSDTDFAGTMTMTWALTPTDEGTPVDDVADDVPSEISADDHAAGLASSLANLATYLRG